MTPTLTLSPFWLGYAVALAVCVGWALWLHWEATRRNAETEQSEAAERALETRRTWARWMNGQVAEVLSERDANEIPREAMWRTIERERGE